MQRFTHIGKPVNAVESRTAAICIHPSGECRIVIAARGFVVIVDPVTEQSQQLLFPEGYVEYPYASYSDFNGIFYTGAGTMFMALDPFQTKFVYWQHVGEPGELVGFAFAEESSGTIYFTAYPHCALFRYERDLGVKRIGSLHASEQYPSYLAAGRDGWIYAGIGTVRRQIVAVHPESGAMRSLVPEAERTRGLGVVHQGLDGEVYGHWGKLNKAAQDEAQGQDSLEWVKLHAGVAEVVPASAVSPSLYQGESFAKVHRALQGTWQLLQHDLGNKELLLQSTDGLSSRTIHLEYDSTGAQLSPIVRGPDHNLYGTSNHPLHFYEYAPAQQELIDHGGKVIELGGGGNICAYAVSGRWLGGAAYAGGHIHLLDTSKLISAHADQRNPKLLHSEDSIHRPRCAVGHSDGKHMIFGGYPGYGSVGGGLCIVAHEHGETIRLTHEQLIQHQSTVSLIELPNGDLLGGTSIETPGGAQPVAEQAVLYRLDWQRKQVVQQWIPIAHAREFVWLVQDATGYIHGISSDSRYFKYDLASSSIMDEQSLAAWGVPVRTGIVMGDDQQAYGVMSQAIFQINLHTGELSKLAVPPKDITAGLAYDQGKLYFGMGSELWMYSLNE